MRAKSVLSIAAQTERLPMPKRSVSAEIGTILAPGEAPLPQRRSGAAQDRAVQLGELLQALTGEGARMVGLNLPNTSAARRDGKVGVHKESSQTTPFEEKKKHTTT